MTESNKALARRAFREIWTEGRLDSIPEIYAEGFIGHIEPRGLVRGVAELCEVVKGLRESSSNYREEIDELIAEGDRVAVRFTASGTNDGPLPMGGDATGRAWRTLGVLVFRIEGERIAEQWEVVNVAGLLGQLGSAEK